VRSCFPFFLLFPLLFLIKRKEQNTQESRNVRPLSSCWACLSCICVLSSCPSRLPVRLPAFLPSCLVHAFFCLLPFWALLTQNAARPETRCLVLVCRACPRSLVCTSSFLSVYAVLRNAFSTFLPFCPLHRTSFWWSPLSPVRERSLVSTNGLACQPSFLAFSSRIGRFRRIPLPQNPCRFCLCPSFDVAWMGKTGKTGKKVSSDLTIPGSG
jgi:hypothetical protein